MSATSSTATPRTADRTTTDAFVGTWKLEAFEVRRPDGTTLLPLGPDPVGRITYDDAGRMAVQVMRPGRSQFASGDMLVASDQERREAWDGFIAYTGTFRVDPDAGTVTHHIEISSFPNWVGDNQVRFFAFGDDVLELTTAPVAYGGTGAVAALVWTRA